jgi:hypothetical protein
MHDLVGYGVQHPHAADLELWLRAAVRGHVGRVNGPPQAYYRLHSENMHATEFAGALTDMRAVQRVFDAFFNEDGRRLAGRSQMRERAMRSIAREALRVACRMLDTEPSAVTEPRGLADLAAEIYPRAVESKLWHAYQGRVCGTVGRLRRYGFARVDSARWASRWWRWQRYGT